MDLNTYYKINSNPLLHKFLRENSYWYKELNRNPLLIDDMIKEMKDKYKLNFSDKIEKFGNSLSIIRSLIETLE